MIRPLRRRHLVMGVLLAVLVPLVYVAALMARPEEPLSESPAFLAEPAAEAPADRPLAPPASAPAPPPTEGPPEAEEAEADGADAAREAEAAAEAGRS